MKQRQKFIIGLLLGLLSLIALHLFDRGLTSAAQPKRFNALAPLEIKTESEWNEFQQQLTIAQKMGIDAIVTDVWWGNVEAQGDQQFNWQYYDRLVQEIKAANLHWIPIISLHQCGGNVGDNCDIPIPSWIWNHFPEVAPQSLKYVSEQGNTSQEVVSLWADHLILREYQEFMDAFTQRYGNEADIIDEIQISMGSAGELRYPAYNAHDDYQYPHRGYFQAYSDPAKASFRQFILRHYGKLPAVNQAWGTQLSSIQEICPPQQPTHFVKQHDYTDTQYGRDFIDWYNQSLIHHGKRMLEVAHQAFDQAFRDIPLGIKIPGIHWQIANPNTPRIAEITTGLIRTSFNFQSPATGYGYLPLLTVAKHLNSDTSRQVMLHYTAVELSNGRDSSMQAYSKAKDLLRWIAETATALEIPIAAENALQGELSNPKAWQNIKQALKHYQFYGFTALRLTQVTNRTKLGYQSYRELIQTFEE